MAEPSARPMPLITAENEFFWTSGADGRLRLQECESCSALIHPPQPVCRYCRGHQIRVRAVSGFATLIGFTVNHRFSLSGLPARYVIAQVAIEEDPRVRLTTNAVECDPEQLELGMRMEVVFEQAGDAWLPLFRPAAEQGEPAALTADEIEPDQMWRHVRPMITPEKFEDKVAITGIGASELGRRLGELRRPHSQRGHPAANGHVMPEDSPEPAVMTGASGAAPAGSGSASRHVADVEDIAMSASLWEMSRPRGRACS